LELEEEYIRDICNDIIKHKPDLVITEKGISGNFKKEKVLIDSNFKFNRFGSTLSN
jgi:hypothetical protein